MVNSSSLSLASLPAPHLRNDCRPHPSSFLMFGSCCQLSRPLAHDCLMCLHLLLAGVPSMKIPTPILTHQDPPPLWKTKLIPFHLPSPTVDSPLLLTQIWVWHPRLVRHFHPPFVLPLKLVSVSYERPIQVFPPVSAFELNMNVNADHFSY